MLHKLIGSTGRLKKLTLLLCATGISTLLSGCLVEKKDVEKLSRTTDTLRIYQANDYIEYNVTAVVSSGVADPVTKYGTLRVEWNDVAPLADPITPATTYAVLKETTTLTYNGSTEPAAVSERYISQIDTGPMDPDQGSIILYAIDDEVDADYWLYPNSATPSNEPVITPIIFESPLSVGNNLSLSFSVMECNTVSNLCENEIYEFSDAMDTVGDTREITTNLGIFTNPFELTFSGGTIDVGLPALEFLGDIRDACGTSADQVTHSGSMFVMPRIGIIQMTNQCQNPTGDDIVFVITARNTNIPY